MNSITLEQITREKLEYYNNYMKIYTDGSQHDDLSGIGVYCSKDKTSYYGRLTDDTNIMTAELAAILAAIEHIEKDHVTEQKIAILTDSLSAATAIQSEKPNHRDDLIEEIKTRIDNIQKRNSTIAIVWIPAHIGIQGNENADKLAKQGREQTEVDYEVGLGKSELKRKIDTFVTDKVQQKLWETRKDTLFKRLVPKVGTKLPIGINNIKLNKLRLETANFHVRRDRSCRSCKRSLTVKHTLMDCSKFNTEREAVRRQLALENKELTLETILSFNSSDAVKPLVKTLVGKIDEIFQI